jgi:recombinational DNA repair ATPase RecF
MATVEAEHQRFLDVLADERVTPDVQRLAEIVHQNIEALAEVGNAKRARSHRLAPIALEGLKTPFEAKQAVAAQDKVVQQAFRIQKLQVGPFRGFMSPETFDLSRDITLVYGPNGSGKTSFCEALEFAMLGAIGEAKAKRIDQHLYCNNVRVNTHAVPELTGLVSGGSLYQIQPNEAKYRFSFIEKNRLDDFARIAAKTPGDQKNLIATLFGVENFASFVRGFNNDLDAVLMLAGPKAKELEGKRKAVESSALVVQQFDTKKEQLQNEARQAAACFDTSKTYKELKAWLLGADEVLGQLSKVKSQLDAPRGKLYDITARDLQQKIDAVKRIGAQAADLRDALKKRATEVSYKDLYTAIQNLGKDAATCPACRTPLDRVVEQPFLRAERALAQLKDLGELQDKAATLKGQLTEHNSTLLVALHAAVSAVANLAPPEELDAAQLPYLPQEPGGKWLVAWLEDDERALKCLLQLITHVEVADAKTRKFDADRVELVKERDRLDALQTTFALLEGRNHELTKDRTAAAKSIADFEALNNKLIKEVAAEKILIEQNFRLKMAYDAYLARLQRYLSDLPGQLGHGLGERARELYNAFNRGDHKNDLLQSLSLPLAENEKITVELAGEPGKKYDALHIFSEGHIRCLGLAILLAKNLDQGCQVVIFDDVINAIDDEHREGIWRTFFDEERLEGKQVILTSHAEEFLNRIQQELGKDRAAQIGRFHFLPHGGEHHLDVDTDPPTKNYLQLAINAVDKHEKRDALRNSRIALEYLTDKVWKWLIKNANGDISLKLSGPKSPVELNNKCQKILEALRKQKLEERFDVGCVMVTSLDTLLKVGGQSVYWNNLNKGTHHEDRDHEFDIAVVRTIVNCLIQLDTALQPPAKGALIPTTAVLPI